MRAGLIYEILERIKSARIAVLGDFCLDAYWFVDDSKSEISVETGQSTRPVANQRYSLGGAGNVANNLAAMGVGKVFAYGVSGNDPFGPEMTGLLKKAGINSDNIIAQKENWSTHVYIKPYIGENEQNRIDFGNFNSLSEASADKLLSLLTRNIPDIDLVIINQQVLSGIHTAYFREKLVELIVRFPEKIFIADSRNYTEHYTGAYRKMNDTEASNQCGFKRTPEEAVPRSEVVQAAKKLYERFSKPVFITRGSRGSLTVSESGIQDIPGLMILSKVDTVGAGDSYLAGVAAALASGFPIDQAAETGSYVAGVTVQKLFTTGTASQSEILAIGSDPDLIYNSELADDIREARYKSGTEIEIIHLLPEEPLISHVIFDHDGTVSTLREGWEQIMAPMMIKAVLGTEFYLADRTLYHKVESRINDLIDKTTGIQTLMQMRLLLDVIREFGFISSNEMLDEHAYKKIYNRELMFMVTEREKKFKRGDLSVEDLTIKNALPLLQKLHKAGIKLYLASGTDEEDVRNEALALGYADLFEGGIFGATGNIDNEAKKIVLDRILNTIGTSSSHKVATFGDGPVEIRETHKRGGITIGVASNEIKRYGLNLTKRTRLIKAGADIVVPDFSRLDDLLALLNIKSNGA